MIKYILYLALFMAVVLSTFWGCSYKGTEFPSQNPFVNIYSVPPDSAVMGAAPIIWWWGTDRDGIIVAYKYIDIPRPKVDASVWAQLVANYNVSPNIPDSVIMIDRTAYWTRTTKNMDTIYLSLMIGADTTEHLFCVKSIDHTEKVSQPECRIYFRTNQPPDSVILKDFEGYDEKDTFWILKGLTRDWNGIPFSWRGSDPDNSVILEYYWWVESYDNPNVIARTSLCEDTLGGLYCGEDSTDGWVKSTNTILRDIVHDFGHWWFKIKVRDDAFYEGARDSFEFYSVWPYFDPSIRDTMMSMFNGTFNHKLLVIFTKYPGWQDDVANTYMNYFNRYVGVYYNSVDTAYVPALSTGSEVRLNVPKIRMKNYSIIYFINIAGALNIGARVYPTQKTLEAFQDYSLAGGRLIFDGRDFFYFIAGFADAYLPYGLPPFDMFGISWQGTPCGFNNASAVHPQYVDLVLDSVKVPSGIMGSVRATGVFPYLSGIPYAEVVYRAGSYVGATPEAQAGLIGLPIACRFAKHTARSAFFGFPLYAMKNNMGQVDSTLNLTFQFVTGAFEPDTTNRLSGF